MSVTVKVTINEASILNKVESLLDDETRMAIQQAFAEIIDPWTPYRSGDLSTDITVTPDGVTYNVPYSTKKYYGEAYTKTVHPLATSHWDEVAMQTEMPVLESRVKEILEERARQLYG